MSHVSFKECVLVTNPEATEFSMFMMEVESSYIFLRDMPHVSLSECVLVANFEATDVQGGGRIILHLFVRYVSRVF